MVRKRVYLASPLGFADSTRGFMEYLAGELEEHVDVSNPWDDTRFEEEFEAVALLDSRSESRERLARVNRELGRANAGRIDAADAVFAVLDGVDVDSGTASEIGYAFAKGKYVCGLRTDFRLAGDNDGAVVNLQVQYFIEASGGEVVSTVDGLVELARGLAGAEE